MRIITVQPLDVALKIKYGEHYTADFVKVMDNTIAVDGEVNTNWENAYAWMRGQLTKRVHRAPVGVVFPIWGWHTYAGREVVMPENLLAQEFPTGTEWMENYQDETKPFLFAIDLEIPDSEVLLSDEVLWHHVLNNFPIMPMCDESGDDLLAQILANHPDQKKVDRFVHKSWEWIFEIGKGAEYFAGKTPGEYIQACFWEIKPEWVRSVRPIPKFPKVNQKGEDKE